MKDAIEIADSLNASVFVSESSRKLRLFFRNTIFCILWKKNLICVLAHKASYKPDFRR